jgi:hypothetical protein
MRAGTTSFETFLEKANTKHNSFYTYKKETYHSLPRDLTITCPTHGDFSQRANRHLSGSGCPKCAREKDGKRRADTTENFVHKMTKKWGNIFNYDKTVYTTILNPVTITCPIHGDFEILPVNAFKGKWHRCLECREKETKKYGQQEFVDICKKIHDNKYTYEKTVYQYMQDKITITCPIHGDFSQRASHHLHNKSGCKKCSLPRHSTDHFLTAAYKVHGDKYDYSKTVYTRNVDKGIIICPNHGEFTQMFMTHLAGKGCPKCKVVTSVPQKSLQEYIKSIYTGPIETNIKIMDKKEVDVNLPKENIAIELDGVFWHSTKGSNYQRLPIEKRRNTALKNQTYKHDELAKKGIRLITILDLEWDNHTEAVKNLLLHSLHVLPKIGARECELKKISYTDCKEFLNTYHVQGATPAKHYYALYNGTDLISVMSFRMTKGEWELARYCSTMSVQGGAQRLLNAFIKEISPSKIVSFCHNRLFSGAVYDSLGFTKEKQYPFDYYFFYKGELFSRRHFTKQKIPKEFHLKGYFETTENYGAHTLFVPGGSKYVKYLTTNPT